MVIFVRRRLIEAARALRDQAVLPANVDDPTEKARQSDAGVPIAWVPFVWCCLLSGQIHDPRRGGIANTRIR